MPRPSWELPESPRERQTAGESQPPGGTRARPSQSHLAWVEANDPPAARAVRMQRCLLVEPGEASVDGGSRSLGGWELQRAVLAPWVAA